MGRWAQARKRGSDRGLVVPFSEPAPELGNDFELPLEAFGDCWNITLVLLDDPGELPPEVTRLGVRWAFIGSEDWTFVGTFGFDDLPITIDGTIGADCDHADGISVEVAWADSGFNLLSPWSIRADVTPP